MLYAITDTLLKVLLKTNKTGHNFYVSVKTNWSQFLCYNWHIVESVIKHQ